MLLRFISFSGFSLRRIHSFVSFADREKLFSLPLHISARILFLAVKKSEKEKEKVVYTQSNTYMYAHPTNL